MAKFIIQTKFEMSEQFLFKKRKKKAAGKNRRFFFFLKKKNGRCFVIGGLIDMNVAVFWETDVGFLKNALSQNFPNYS